MPAPKNLLKSALAEGQTLFGCWLALADIYTTDLMGSAGFDWLVIDGEHAPNDLRSIRDQVIALESSPSHVMVRVPVGETWMIKQMLDIGVQSLLVPMVESADQARDLVRAVTYPPRGVRGVGPAIARASRYNEHTDYIATADEQILLMVQVESRAGMAALDDILTVEGVHGVFIGPSDLAADMGHQGDASVPEVHDLILDALSRIEAAGRTAGILTTDPDMIEQSRAAGARFISIGADILLFSGAARAAAARWCPKG